MCEETGLSFCADDDKVRQISHEKMSRLLKASYVLLYERKGERREEELGKLVSNEGNWVTVKNLISSSFLYQENTEETTAERTRRKEAVKTRCAEEQVDCPKSLKEVANPVSKKELSEKKVVLSFIF